MRLWILILGLFSLRAQGYVSPYTAEGTVKEDLTNLVSKIIPEEDFLIQVNATVVTRAARIPTGGERIDNARKKLPPPDPMPGFVPEIQEQSPPELTQSYQRFQIEKTPRLQKIVVTTSFNSRLPKKTIAQARRLVSEYMNTNFPTISQLKFFTLPMITPKGLEFNNEKAKEIETTPLEENLWKWGPWIAFGIIAFLWLLGQRNSSKITLGGQLLGGGQFSLPGQKTSPDGGSQKQSLQTAHSIAHMPYPSSGMNLPHLAGYPQGHTASQQPKKQGRFMKKILSQAVAFRKYYEKLDEEQKAELCAILEGPAFNSLMENLGLDSLESIDPIQELEEKTAWHEIQFDNYIQANQWQFTQFFGFLQHLSQNQLLSLVGFETDLHVCLMLRFMQPKQSAYVLDNLSHERRMDILSHLSTVHSMPLTQVADIENRIREVVHRIPSVMLGPGKQELDFWGSVLDVSAHASEIVEEFEQTKSDIVPHLKKYKFSLEDAALLPDQTLSRVLAELDNEEIGLALSTCKVDVSEVLLDAISEKRRQMIEQQLPMYRTVEKRRADEARTKLTKKIREAMVDA